MKIAVAHSIFLGTCSWTGNNRPTIFISKLSRNVLPKIDALSILFMILCSYFVMFSLVGSFADALGQVGLAFSATASMLCHNVIQYSLVQIRVNLSGRSINEKNRETNKLHRSSRNGRRQISWLASA